MTALPQLSVLPAFLVLLAAVPAQNTVGFSIEGGALSSGTSTTGTAAPYVSLTIEGFPEVRVPIAAGDSPAAVAVDCAVALAQAGFHVTIEGPGRIRVTGHTNGQPIRGGAAIGENDSGLAGVDLDIARASVSFGSQAGPAPSPSGYAVARPTGSMPSQGGMIRTTLEFEGATAPTVVTVNVPPGAPPQQIEQMMHQAFVQNGIVPRAWAAPHLFVPAATQPLFGLTRDLLGRRVSHVAFEATVETEIVAMHLQSCMPIAVGVAEYGWSWPSPAMRLDSASHPRVGAPIDLDLRTGLPFTLAGLVVGFADWALPLPQLLNGTPAPAFDGPTLFVQPLGSPLAGVTNALGELQRTLVVPGDPVFVGLPLRWQGFDAGAPGPTTVWLSNGLQTNVGP